MSGSLRSRLFLGFVVLTVVILLVSAVTLLLVVARNNLAVRVELRNTAVRVLPNPEIDLGRPEGYRSAVDLIAERTGYRILVLSRQGRVLADSGAEEYPGFPDFNVIPKDPLRDVFTINDTDGRLWLYTGRPLPNGMVLLIMEPRQPLRDVFNSPISLDLLRALAQSGIVALVLSVIMAFLLSNSVASPLQEISTAARQLAAGRKTFVHPEGPREVRVLGEAFNDMATKVFTSQQSQRDFVANVSHELKTPLTSIQGFAQAILDGTARTPVDQERAAQVIYDEASRMHRLVLDLLDLARLDAGTADLRREPVEIDHLLQAVIARLTPQSVQAEVSLVDQIGSLPAVIGDGDRLSQVFNNLVENAIKHTPAGGKVWLSAEVGQGQVRVSIRDTGRGIPEDELERIFERFYQLDKARKGGPAHGAGLGLAIAHQIVEAHDGQITVESRVGEGSLFQVTLPIARSDDPTLQMPAVK
jgi:signal transduction histidine kinase